MKSRLHVSALFIALIATASGSLFLTDAFARERVSAHGSIARRHQRRPVLRRRRC